MTENEISEYDTNAFFLITDDNTNLTEINSINNNHNVTLINDDTPDNTNESALTPSKSITNHMPKRRKIPVWDFIDDTDNSNLVNFATKNIPSEQIFSVTKHTISPTRNQLSTENVCASLCLKQILLTIIRKINKTSANMYLNNIDIKN
ncbi:unnamed protein product [Rhizophagus irregularis]|nr:unnamed protein product [Rhizophagus irregularis]